MLKFYSHALFSCNIHQKANEEKELLQKQYINGLVADETDEKYLNLPTVEVSGEVQRIFKSQ